MTNEDIIEEVRRARDEANAAANRLGALLDRLEQEEIWEERAAAEQSERPVLAAVGGRTVEPSVYVPAQPDDVVPTDQEIVEAEFGSCVPGTRSHEERETRIQEVSAARNCLIFESIFRVELTRPVRQGTSPKTRIHFVEATSEAEVAREFRTKALERQGVGIMEVRRANEGDLIEFLAYS